MFSSRSWRSTFLQSLLVATEFPRVCLAQNGTPASTTPSVQPSSTTSAPAQTHTIQVGLADHKFKPETTVANVGDTIEFAFYPRNHSIVRAEYGFPCIPYEMTGPSKTGFFSGFQPVDTVLSSPPTYSILINDTNPIFFYCSAPGSCLTYGMVGAINPNASTSIEKQQRLALNSTYMLNPGEPFPAETPSPSHPPSNNTASSPGPEKANDNKGSLSKRTIIAMVVTSACITILAALLFFFWGRTKGLKDEVKRKATTIWRPDAHPTGHVRNMSMMIPRAELGTTEPDNAMHHQSYYYQYPHQAPPPTDDGTPYQHQHQPYPLHAAFSPAQTMSLYYPPPPPSSPSPLHMHPTKVSITSPIDPHPAYAHLQHQYHQQGNHPVQIPIRHELESQERKQESGNAEANITTTAATTAAITAPTTTTTITAVKQDTKPAAHQVREVRASTPTTPMPTSTRQNANAGADADPDEIEPVPSYFDAVYASSRAARGEGRRERGEVDRTGKEEGEGKDGEKRGHV